LPTLADTQGDAVTQARSGQGIAFVDLTTSDGSDSPIQKHDSPIVGGKGSAAVMAGSEAKTFDGVALPNNVAEGDVVRNAASEYGVQYFFPVTEDGAETPMTNEDEAMAAAQAGYTVHSQATTFDGAAFPTTGDTEGDAVPFASSGQGVQFVTLVSDDGSDYGQIKGYDSGTDSNKSFEVSPLSSHHSEETLADVTNETNATTNRFIDMDGYRNVGIHFEKTGGADSVTLTLQASNQDDGTAPSSITAWIDVTSDLTGSASFTADEFIMVDTPVPIKWIRVQTVSAGGANDADYEIYVKKVW